MPRTCPRTRKSSYTAAARTAREAVWRRRKLIKFGYENVRMFEGGLEERKNAGFPIEKV